MEIFKINEDTLKIVASCYDACENGTVEDDFDSTVLEGDLFERAIAAVRRFDSEFLEHRLVFHVFYSPKGELEMFVQRMECLSMSLVNTNRGKASAEVGIKGHGPSGAVYAFREISPMLQSCFRLIIAGYRGESKAYSDNGIKRYFLVLEESSPLPEEYGATVCKGEAAFYIMEHCRLICTDAVSILGALA